MIPRVFVELMKLGTIMMENISEVNVLNAIPLLGIMEYFSISYLFNHGC